MRYVCTYVYVYVYVCVYEYVYVCVYIYIHVHVHVHVNMHIHIHIHIHILRHICYAQVLISQPLSTIVSVCFMYIILISYLIFSS